MPASDVSGIPNAIPEIISGHNDLSTEFQSFADLLDGIQDPNIWPWTPAEFESSFNNGLEGLTAVPIVDNNDIQDSNPWPWAPVVTYNNMEVEPADLLNIKVDADKSQLNATPIFQFVESNPWTNEFPGQHRYPSLQPDNDELGLQISNVRANRNQKAVNCEDPDAIINGQLQVDNEFEQLSMLQEIDILKQRHLRCQEMMVTIFAELASIAEGHMRLVGRLAS